MTKTSWLCLTYLCPVLGFLFIDTFNPYRHHWFQMVCYLVMYFAGVGAAVAGNRARR